MEGFASGYARGRAAAMLEHFSSHRASAMPDEMEPVDVSARASAAGMLFSPHDLLAACSACRGVHSALPSLPRAFPTPPGRRSPSTRPASASGAGRPASTAGRRAPAA
jgi:hypothetical protein